MEWREALDEARLGARRSDLQALQVDVAEARQQVLATVTELIDTRADFEAAAGLVGQLMYIDRFSEQVDEALDDLS
jgi:molecular chaperone HscB